jgi:hypothetical protein
VHERIGRLIEKAESTDIFPSLIKYKTEHNADNLQKLCVDIADFCRSVYASTKSEEERKIYRQMLTNLIK